MPAAGKAGRVFRPRSLNWALELFLRHPDALRVAGGTAVLPGRSRSGGSPAGVPPTEILYLGQVAELGRIYRTVRVLEIGSALTLNRILSAGRNVIPEALAAALGSVATPSVRNLATLGGNICSACPWNDSLPPLYAIDAQVEVQAASASRWLGIDRFISGPGRTVLRPGELLTRIRIPLEDWPLQVYRRVSRHGTASRALVSLCGLARTGRGTVEAVRIALGGVGETVFRSRELEAELEGHRLPLPPARVDALVRLLGERLHPWTDAYTTDRYRRATALRLVRWFLEEIHLRRPEEGREP